MTDQTFLTVGIESIPVLGTGAAMTPMYAGSRQRMFDGSLMTRIRAIKQEWRITTPPMALVDSEATQLTLNGGQQYASGDYLRGALVMADFEITNVVPYPDGEEFQEHIEFTMREV